MQHERAVLGEIEVMGKLGLILSKALAFIYVFLLNISKKKKKVTSGKILIIAAGHMGNAIMDIDAICALKDFYKGKNKMVYLLCALPLWKTFQAIGDMTDFIYMEHVYPYQGNGTDLRNVHRTISKVRQHEFEEILVTLNNAPLAHYVVAASSCNKSWGVFDNVKHTHGSLRYYFEKKYTDKIYVPVDLHETQRLKMLLKEIGVKDYHVRIHHIKKSVAYALPNRPYITIAMDSMSTERRWPRENYTELVHVLLDRYPYDICCTGGEVANEIYEYCAKGLPDTGRFHNYAGKTGMKEWFELIRGAALHIGVDSGSIHVAASVGTQAISLSGVWDGKRCLPYDVDIENENTCQPVCVYRNDIDIKELSCYACKVYGGRSGRGNNECYKQCRKGGTCLCLKNISVGTVVHTVELCLNKGGRV
ncbi:lipopolysaccharide heptosyltransferase family protein [Lachnospiraceae bacterium]|nr:lipopolysaccharide heptosyltransferase family protein [Lachnospiraceae bacterium]